MSRASRQKEILYVAYRDESLEEGISYALYLAGQMDAGLRIVLLSRNGFGGKFHNVMDAVAFAEASEHETARRMFAGEEDGDDAASIQSYLVERCSREGIKANVHIGLEGTVSVVQEFLKRKRIDLVLLSPAVTGSRNILNRLLRNSPRPVVTMSRGSDNDKMLAEGGTHS
ncbi:MAG: universal stress protein [Nitrospirota bacterium]|jgi:hypothetical protein